jgi:acyl-CoA synthetase (AMP-forming)/AMP-acid ligase II
MRVLQSLKDIVERNATLHAAYHFQIFGDRLTSFSEYAVRAHRLASALHRLGLQSQDRVSILAMNCPEYTDVYGAAEVAPYIIAPVNFRLAPPEILWILRDVAPQVLIFESQYLPTVDALRSQLPGIRHFVQIGGEVPAWATDYASLLASGSPEGAPLEPRGSDIHAILYTSGTTGRPKGVMIPHSGLLALGEAWALELGADLGHRILLTMPFFHIGARSQGYGLTIRGGTLVIHRSFDARAVVETIQRDRITQLHLAPTLVQQVLDLPDIDRYDLSSLRTLNYAAAPMPLTTLKRAIRRFGPVLINGYGQTEGAGCSLRKVYHRLDGDEKDLRRLTSVGQPVHDCAARIVDESDNEVARGAVGEICLRSPQNMAGYWNNSAATIEALRNGWLHTGDLGRMDEDSFVYLVDRKKDMIVSGGENVYSREVEEALMAHGSVQDAAVIGVADLKWGEAVKGIVVLKQSAALTAEELIAHCRGLIAGYKCPKSIDFVDELPRLPSGKINKVALRGRY